MSSRDTVGRLCDVGEDGPESGARSMPDCEPPTRDGSSDTESVRAPTPEKLEVRVLDRDLPVETGWLRLGRPRTIPKSMSTRK